MESCDILSSVELEMYEKQLVIAKEEVLRYKKAARLWKSRYEQERRARCVQILLSGLYRIARNPALWAIPYVQILLSGLYRIAGNPALWAIPYSQKSCSLGYIV